MKTGLIITDTYKNYKIFLQDFPNRLNNDSKKFNLNLVRVHKDFNGHSRVIEIN